MCEDLRALAQQRGLSLRGDGPAPFVVRGDAVKTRRLAQNLILNAIKYTALGGVHVSWGDSNLPDDDARWLLSVRDSGPGLHTHGGAPLAAAIERATDLAREGDAANAAQATPAPAREESLPARAEHGEGIGLSIVKRLAELLDAGIEVESVAGNGTTFRVYLPRRYGAA